MIIMTPGNRVGNSLGDPSKGTYSKLDDGPFGSSTIDTLKIYQHSKSMPSRAEKGRWFDGYLKASGWESEYPSVQTLLDHLSRRTKSESSRIQYLQTLATLCRREGKAPDQLARLSRHEAEDAVHVERCQLFFVGKESLCPFLVGCDHGSAIRTVIFP